MKKIFTLFAALAMVMSMSAATKTVYFKTQEWWHKDGAASAAYYWGTGGNANAWPGTRMTKVSGETNMWSIDIDTDKYQNIIFTRVNGSGNVEYWGAKTVDLIIPTNNANFLTLSTTEVWGDPGATGNWSVYAPDAPKSYKDITITVIANATPKIHYWEGGDKMVGSDWETMPEMVATGEENTYSYTIKDVDEATGVNYLIVVGELQSADKQAFENVTVNFKDLLPQVAVMGVTGWTGDKMTVADDYLSASVTLTLEAAKDYELKLTVNGEWFGSNAITITKENNSASFAENGDGNGKLTTDLAGDYVFTYTYATKTLVVTYPEPTPTVTLSCTDMDKMYMAMRDMLQLEGTSTNDEYVTVALYNYAATVGDYQAFIAFGDLELETESLTINRGSEEWTLTATIDADTAIYEFTATTTAPKTETIAPRAATWGGDAMNGYTIDCTTTIGDVQILVQDGTEYGMGWMLNMAINDALVVEGATIDAPTWEEDNLVLDVTVVSGTLDEYTIQLTATPKPATEIIANATMALSEDEYEVGTMIVSATWGEYPLSVKLNGWPYYGYGEYAEANLIIEIDPENYDVVDAYSTATLEKKEDVAVLTGTFSDWNGNKYALTLTIAEPAAAPVVETVNVVCTDMVQGEEWGTPVLTGTCNLGNINISLYLEDTDHPESVYGEYGFAEYPMGLFPAVEVTIEGEDSFIMLELMENTVAVYTDGETQDSFVGTFLGSDWKVYVLDMKTPDPDVETALDNVTTTVAPVKAIVNGQLVILKDGVQYNAQGAVVK